MRTHRDDQTISGTAPIAIVCRSSVSRAFDACATATRMAMSRRTAETVRTDVHSCERARMAARTTSRSMAVAPWTRTACVTAPTSVSSRPPRSTRLLVSDARSNADATAESNRATAPNPAVTARSTSSDPRTYMSSSEHSSSSDDSSDSVFSSVTSTGLIRRRKA